jgi:hypothetical protein
MRGSRHRIWIGALLFLLALLVTAAPAGASGPSWSFESPTYDFTPTPAGGAPSAPHEFVLTNTGDEAITISKFVRGGDVDEFFKRTGSTCHNGLVLEPGASCHVDIAFAPTTSGRKTGYIKAEALNEEPPLAKVELEGEGVGPAVSIESEEVEFGSIPEGASSRQTVTVEDLGPGPLRIYGASVVAWDYWGSTLEYPTTNPFALKGGSCLEREVLAVSEACTIEVAFAPPKQGSFGSILTLEDNAAPRSPQRIDLDGKGIEAPPVTALSGSTSTGSSGGSSSGQTEGPTKGSATTEVANHGYEPPVRMWGRYVGSKATVAGKAAPFANVSRVKVYLERDAPGPEKSAIGWSARCNSVGGPVRVSPNHLVPDRRELTSTSVGCARRQSKEDEWLYRLFAADPTWHLRGRELILKAGKSTLWLRRSAAS